MLIAFKINWAVLRRCIILPFAKLFYIIDRSHDILLGEMAFRGSLNTTLNVFIWFCSSQCDSKCESQKLNLCGIGYQSHLRHKCHVPNSVDVCCDKFKESDSPNVWYFNFYSSFVTLIVSHIEDHQVLKHQPLEPFYTYIWILC